jgi:mannose-6-phosphate isomerase-like protein (cupin superfamily)
LVTNDAIDERLLEVSAYTGPGYKPLVDFGAWRVAVLNYLEANQPHRIDRFERHMQTDEVFILLQGHAVLLIGEGDDAVERIFFQPMEMGKVYNIKARTWHSAVLSKEVSLLVVENKDTGENNTGYIQLSSSHRRLISDFAQS